MENKIKLRKAELRDASTLARNNVEMAKETEGKALDFQTVLLGVKAIIKDPHKGFFLVAEDAGTIAGQMMVTNEWSDWRNKYFYWIQSVYVSRDSRKKGVFSSLYYHLKELASAKKNVAGLRLYVDETNETAQQVYQQIGMDKSGYVMYEVEF